MKVGIPFAEKNAKKPTIRQEAGKIKNPCQGWQGRKRILHFR